MDPSLQEQRDALAQAIAAAAVKGGICREGASLTGPQLLMLCADMGDALAVKAQCAQPDPDSQVVRDAARWRLIADRFDHETSGRCQRVLADLGFNEDDYLKPLADIVDAALDVSPPSAQVDATGG